MGEAEFLPGRSPAPAQSPLTPRELALAVLGEAGLWAAAILVGSLGVQVLSTVGLLPDPKVYRWALFAVSPLMLAISALAYGAATRWLPALGPEPAMSEAPGPRAQRDAIIPVPGFASVSRSVGVVASHTALALLGSVLIALLLQAVGLAVEEQGAIREIVAGGFGLRPELLGLAVGGVILAPLTEEWLFRGLLFRRLWRLGAPWVAYLLPALLFALIHFNPAGLVTYLWLGLVFAHAYRLTGRLWVAMAVHCGNNAFTLAMLLLGVTGDAGTPTP